MFDEISKEAEKFGEDNDCAVRAVAILLGSSYKRAHALLQKFGRRNKKGTNFHNITRPALESQGFKVVAISDRDPLNKAKTIRTVERLLKFRRRERFLIRTSGHILAARDGKVHDWTKGRCHRIVAIHKVFHGDDENNPFGNWVEVE